MAKKTPPHPWSRKEGQHVKIHPTDTLDTDSLTIRSERQTKTGWDVMPAMWTTIQAPQTNITTTPAKQDLKSPVDTWTKHIHINRKASKAGTNFMEYAIMCIGENGTALLQPLPR